MHDHNTVLTIDRDSLSIGATQSGFPVSLRRRIALLRRSTGWYVSGTKSTISTSCSRVSARHFASPGQLKPYLDRGPDHQNVETPPSQKSTHRSFGVGVTLFIARHAYPSTWPDHLRSVLLDIVAPLIVASKHARSPGYNRGSTYLHVVFCTMNPPTSGPISGPIKGLAV